MHPLIPPLLQQFVGYFEHFVSAPPHVRRFRGKAVIEVKNVFQPFESLSQAPPAGGNPRGSIRVFRRILRAKTQATDEPAFAVDDPAAAGTSGTTESMASAAQRGNSGDDGQEFRFGGAVLLIGKAEPIGFEHVGD